MSDEMRADVLTTSANKSLWRRLTPIANTALQALLFFLAFGVLLQNGFLQKENKRLRISQSSMVPKDVYLQAIGASKPVVGIGQHIQTVRGVSLDGKFQEIRIASGQLYGTLVISFSPVCVHCTRNQDGLTLLDAALRAKGWQVLWVSRDPLEISRPYCSSHGIGPVNVLADPTNRTYVQLAQESVPNLIALDAHGVVEKVWPGELEKSWSDVFAFFRIPLPPTLTGKLGARVQ